MRRRSASFATCWKPTSSGHGLFARIGEYLAEQGLQVSQGTIVNAPSVVRPVRQ